MPTLTPHETLEKPGSDFRGWEKPTDLVLLPNACRKCGHHVVCVYADMGTTDYCDTCHHICTDSACDYLEKREDFGLTMGARDTTGPSSCPLCGRCVS